MTLTKDKTISILLKLSNNILSIYLKLAKLEVKGLKNSLLYQKELKSLNSLLELEDSLYANLNININDLIDFFNANEDLTLLSDFEMLNDASLELLIKKHIYNHLTYLRKQRQVQEYQNIVIDSLEVVPYNSSIYLENQIYDDMERLFCFLMEEGLDTLPNEEAKKALEYKYLIAYLNPRLKEFVASNFEKKEKLYLSLKNCASILDIDNHDYHKFLRSYFYKYIQTQIIFFLSIKDKELKNSSQRQMALIAFNAIKAYLEIVPKDYFEVINKKIRDIMKRYQRTKSLDILDTLLSCPRKNSNIYILDFNKELEYDDEKFFVLEIGNDTMILEINKDLENDENSKRF